MAPGAVPRGERYAAIDLTGHRAYLAYQRAATLSLYDEMITTGAWWDYVDEVAARRVGPLLAARPEVIRPVILRWSCDRNLWRRRSSIICQLSFKAATDLGLLYACIDANLDDQDFFLRKAIGWALRQYARTDPAEVGRFVSARGAEEHPVAPIRSWNAGAAAGPRRGPAGTELTARPTAAGHSRAEPPHGRHPAHRPLP